MTWRKEPQRVRFYNAVIDECLVQGIKTGHGIPHFDMPIELQNKYGGWESKHVVDLFAKFAGQCFRLFKRQSDRLVHI